MNTKYGVIANCRFCDVKNEPRVGGETLFTVSLGTKLAIDIDNSEKGYYKVFFANGTSGYCVRRFVMVLK